MAFLHGNPEQLDASRRDTDPDLRTRLGKLRSDLERRLVKYFSTADELKAEIWHALAKAIETQPRPG